MTDVDPCARTADPPDTASAEPEPDRHSARPAVAVAFLAALGSAGAATANAAAGDLGAAGVWMLLALLLLVLTAVLYVTT